MQTVKFQKPLGVDFERLRCVGVASETLGGHVIYYDLPGTMIMYRYYASKQRWERIEWVDDANPYDDLPNIKPPCK